jgi:hypothetical protein
VHDPLLGPTRDDAHRASLLAALSSLEAHVVPAGRSRFDPRSEPPPREAIEHGPARDGEIRIGVGQDRHFGAIEGGEHFGHAARDALGAEDAAVEKHVRPLDAFSGVSREERDHVTRHRDIALVREAESDERGPRAGRSLPRGHARKESLQHDPFGVRLREARRSRPPDQPRSRTGDRHRGVVRRFAAEQPLLGRAARVDERRERVRRQPIRRRDQARLEKVREGEIHVVAPEEQVIAHGDTLDPGRSIRGVAERSQEREIRGATPHVAHQDGGLVRLGEAAAAARAGQEIADPRRAGALHVIVEGRLRLLEQPHREPRHPGRFERQLSRTLVEGRGEREHDVLLLQGMLAKRLVPSAPHVREVRRAGLDR